MNPTYSKSLLSALMLSTLLPTTASASALQSASEPPMVLLASTSNTSQVYYQFGIPGGTIGGPSLLKNGVIYVDVRGIAENAGLKMEWDKSGQRALFKGWTKSFVVRIGSQSGVLDGKTVDLGGIPFKSKEDGIYVPARFIVKAFEGNNLRLDPKTNTLSASDLKTYNIFTETYSGRTYTLIKAPSIWFSFLGNTLRLIQDGTGNITATLDLLKLGGEEDAYYIEGIDNDILLLRGNQKGLLTLIDRKTGERTLLYKELLTSEDQEYAENNDVPYKGDTLKFVKRSGDKLYFSNDSPLTGKKDLIYTLGQ